MQILEVMEGHVEKWEIPEEEEEDEFWGFEDLESESDTSSFSISPQDSISTSS